MGASELVVAEERVGVGAANEEEDEKDEKDEKKKEYYQHWSRKKKRRRKRTGYMSFFDVYSVSIPR